MIRSAVSKRHAFTASCTVRRLFFVKRDGSARRACERGHESMRRLFGNDAKCARHF
jgi:hypothetical protein